MDKNIKLSGSIPSSNVKIIELYNKLENEKLIPDPDFQRKLVWKRQHKYHFIETILLNYPFPEIYIASSDIDVETLQAREIVVDGQQRLTTIRDFIKGEGDFIQQDSVASFATLDKDQKKDFLNYYVSVRDLKDMPIHEIKDIFQRINNTEYSLNAVEKQNAQYGDGEFLIFCKQITDLDEITKQDSDIILDKGLRGYFVDFWKEVEVFDDNDNSRMLALQYVANLIVTLCEPDYFHRNTKTQRYITEYNNEFPMYQKVLSILETVITFIKDVKLESGSYWFRKPNLFNLIVELSKVDLSLIKIEGFQDDLNKIDLLSAQYFSKVDLEKIDEDYKLYFEYAKQGVNDRKQRLHRGEVLEKIIKKHSEDAN